MKALRVLRSAPFLLPLLGALSCGGAERPAVPPAIALPVDPGERPPAPPVKGIWLGSIQAGPKALRLQLRVDPGATACALDSVDQGSFGIPCRFTVGAAEAGAATVAFDVPDVKGGWTGTIARDGATLTGTWTQGGMTLPLTLKRQATALDKPKIARDAAMPPVDVTALKPVIDADLAAALDHGDLAPATGGGVTIGVVQHGVRRVWSYGAAKPDSLFEIGSISKTFTALILAQLAAQKKVRLDQPVRELLPAGTVAKPETGAEITLLDLSTQHSGLPRLPDNLKPANPANPYVDYDEKALFAFLAQHGVARPADAPFGYSNLGVGLLGDALARKAGVRYEALLRQQVTGPLGMRDTVVTLTPALKKRLAQGHDAAHKPAQPWDFAALAGAGAIRSTAGDMLTYLEAELHPDKLPASVKGSPAGKTLAAAIAETHVVRAEAFHGEHIALNWFRVDETGTYWHNGGTGGYSSDALFTPGHDFAVVVLFNGAPGDDFADSLAKHVAQRLRGVAAVSMAPPP